MRHGLGGAASGALPGGTGAGKLVGTGTLVGTGALVGGVVPAEVGNAGRQPSFCAPITALNRSPATGASLAGSGTGASAVWTLVSAVDSAATEGVLDVQAGVGAAGAAAAADDMAKGTTTAAATAAADNGSAKAHLRNMNPPCSKAINGETTTNGNVGSAMVSTTTSTAAWSNPRFHPLEKVRAYRISGIVTPAISKLCVVPSGAQPRAVYQARALALPVNTQSPAQS